MKKKQIIITSVVVLLSLLLPLPQKAFIFILSAYLIATIAFLLYTLISKKVFLKAPVIFKVLLMTIIVMELEFTKYFIFSRELTNYGYLLGRINYIIEFVILGILFLFNFFFVVNFVCKLVIEKDPVAEMNSKMFEIESNNSLSTEEQTKAKNKLMKNANYYTELTLAHRKLLAILIFTGIFSVIQIITCFLKRNIILEPTIGTAVGFIFLMLLSITLLEVSVYSAAKK